MIEKTSKKLERTIQNSKILYLGCFLFLLLGLFTAKSVSAIANQISFQGKLTDSSGSLVTDGTYYLKFSIYDSSSGGTCQYTAAGSCGSATTTPVTLTSGIFSVNLGDTDNGINALASNLFNADALYLGITVCSGPNTGCDAEMTPRKRITAAPYAFNADRLSGLTTSTQGGDSSYVPVTDSSGDLRLSNSLFLATSTAGQLGIGTSTVPTGYKAYLESTTAADKLLVIRANASQTGNLTEWQNSSGVSLLSIDPTGGIYTSGTLSIFGNLNRINNVAYTWPSSQGGANTYLKNDGSGGLTWATVTGGSSINDWGRFDETYGVSALMTSSSYPVWFDNSVYASSSVLIAGAEAHLDIGAPGNGLSQLFVQASSSEAVPLVIRGPAGGTGNTDDLFFAIQNSSGNNILSFSTSTYGDRQSNGAALTIGVNGHPGWILLNGDGTDHPGIIVMKNKENTYLQGSYYASGWTGSDDYGNSTSSLSLNGDDAGLYLFQQSGYDSGTFNVKPAGDISTSGTLKIFNENGTNLASFSSSSWLGYYNFAVLELGDKDNTMGSVINMRGGQHGAAVIGFYDYSDSFVGGLQTQGDSVMFLAGDSGVTSSLSFSELILGKETGFDNGRFYVDGVTGNLSTSGTLSIFGDLNRINNVAYTWPSSQGGANTYLKNDGSGGLTWATVSGGSSVNDWGRFGQTYGVDVLMASSSFPVWFDNSVYASSSVKITGTGSYLDVGIDGNGVASLFVGATSSESLPLLIKSPVGGTGNSDDLAMSVIDSLDEEFFSLGTSTQLGITQAATLSLGSENHTGLIVFRGGSSTGGGSIVMLNDSEEGAQSFYGRQMLSLSNIVQTTTSSLETDRLRLFQQTGYDAGTFNVDFSGGVSTSGTIQNFVVSGSGDGFNDYLQKWLDSNGDLIASLTSSTFSYIHPLNDIHDFEEGSILTLGTDSKEGALYLKGDGRVVLSTEGVVTGLLNGSELYLSDPFNPFPVTTTYGYRELIFGSSDEYANGIFYINPSGDVSTSGTLAVYGGEIFVQSAESTDNPLVIRSNSTQTGNLTEWQDSLGNKLGSVASTTIAIDGFSDLGLVLSLGNNYEESDPSFSRGGLAIDGDNFYDANTFILHDTIFLTADAGNSSIFNSHYLSLGKASSTDRSAGLIYLDGDDGIISASNTIQNFVVSGGGSDDYWQEWLDSNGDSRASLSSSTFPYVHPRGDAKDFEEAVILTLGDDSREGILYLEGDGRVILNTDGVITGLLNGSDLYLSDPFDEEVSATTTYGYKEIVFVQDEGYDQGYFHMDDSGNISTSGSIRLFGDLGSPSYNTGLSLFSVSDDGSVVTNTLQSFVGDVAGSTGFAFDTVASGGSMASDTADRMLAVFQNNGVNKVSISAGGNVYAANSFIANSTDYGIGDVAEYVNLANGETAEAGDVLVIDTTGSNVYKKSDSAYAKNVAGVVSDTGKFVMGASGLNRAPLALAGLVKVKVTNENGAINPGDYLITASKPGYAMKYDPANSLSAAGLVGMALESLIDTEGKITILVNKGLVAGASNNVTMSVDGSGQLISNNNLDLAGGGITNVGSIAAASGLWQIDSEGKLIAKSITADKIQTKELVLAKDQTQESTIGEATILSGQQNVEVLNTKIKKNSKIFVTFRGNPGSFWWIGNQEDGKFSVFLSSNAAQDITFDYWLVTIDEEDTTASVGTEVIPGANNTNPFTNLPPIGSTSGSDSSNDGGTTENSESNSTETAGNSTSGEADTTTNTNAATDESSSAATNNENSSSSSGNTEASTDNSTNSETADTLPSSETTTETAS